MSRGDVMQSAKRRPNPNAAAARHGVARIHNEIDFTRAGIHLRML
jgi:hypothetical protein